MVLQCERLRDRFALLDAPLSTADNRLEGIRGVADWRARFDSTYAALYFPWVRVLDPLQQLEALRPVASRFVLTDAPSAPASRRWPLRAAARFAESLGVEVVAVEDFDGALTIASSSGTRTLVTGSFHTVGDAMARLQVSPLSG